MGPHNVSSGNEDEVRWSYLGNAGVGGVPNGNASSSSDGHPIPLEDIATVDNSGEAASGAGKPWIPRATSVNVDRLSAAVAADHSGSGAALSPASRFLQEVGLTEEDAERLGVLTLLKALPHKERTKYGRRKHLTEDEKHALTKERNREHARATRRRRKLIIETLQILNEHHHVNDNAEDAVKAEGGMAAHKGAAASATATGKAAAAARTTTRKRKASSSSSEKGVVGPIAVTAASAAAVSRLAGEKNAAGKGRGRAAVSSGRQRRSSGGGGGGGGDRGGSPSGSGSGGDSRSGSSSPVHHYGEYAGDHGSLRAWESQRCENAASSTHMMTSSAMPTGSMSVMYQAATTMRGMGDGSRGGGGGGDGMEALLCTEGSLQGSLQGRPTEAAFRQSEYADGGEIKPHGHNTRQKNGAGVVNYTYNVDADEDEEEEEEGQEGGRGGGGGGEGRVGGVTELHVPPHHHIHQHLHHLYEQPHLSAGSHGTESVGSPGFLTPASGPQGWDSADGADEAAGFPRHHAWDDTTTATSNNNSNKKLRSSPPPILLARKCSSSSNNSSSGGGDKDRDTTTTEAHPSEIRQRWQSARSVSSSSAGSDVNDRESRNDRGALTSVKDNSRFGFVGVGSPSPSASPVLKAARDDADPQSESARQILHQQALLRQMWIDYYETRDNEDGEEEGLLEASVALGDMSLVMELKLANKHLRTEVQGLKAAAKQKDEQMEQMQQTCTAIKTAATAQERQLQDQLQQVQLMQGQLQQQLEQHQLLQEQLVQQRFMLQQTAVASSPSSSSSTPSALLSPSSSSSSASSGGVALLSTLTSPLPVQHQPGQLYSTASSVNVALTKAVTAPAQPRYVVVTPSSQTDSFLSPSLSPQQQGIALDVTGGDALHYQQQHDHQDKRSKWEGGYGGEGQQARVVTI